MHGHQHHQHHQQHHVHSHHDRHGPHGHALPSHARAFALGIGLNLVYIIIEVIFGLLSGSVALLADAGHNLSDVLGLAVAWAGAELSKRPPTRQFTFGLGGSSILAALANALLLMVAVGAIGWEAMTRLQAPAPVASTTVIIVASVGIAINFATALLFLKGQAQDINIRGAFLHMLADAGVSLAVVIGGIAMYFTQFYWIDPAISLLIVAVILWSSWGLLTEAVRMALGGVPRNVDIDAVQAMLEARPGVSVVHDLHVWPMSTSETALTAHLVMPGGHPGRAFLQTLEQDLRAAFPIHHSTIQIELEDEEALCQTRCGAPD